MTEQGNSKSGGWAGAWPDALAFVAGLALAWFGHWQTKDLVWSLWLSSLLVGYAMIVRSIFGTGIFIATKAWGDRAMLQDTPKAPLLAGGAVFLIGGLSMLVFFTVHFGGFHYVHSIFLNLFFPIQPGIKGEPDLTFYLQVLRDYWPFVLVAAVAERRAFRVAAADSGPPDTSVKAADVNLWLANPKSGFTVMTTPYKNVMRLHLLLFFFAFAHFAKLDSFLIYAVVYAVYFFPWSLIKRDKATG